MWKGILGLTAIAMLLIIVVQNTQIITLNFLFMKIRMSQIVLIIMVALIGFAGGYILAQIDAVRRRRKQATAGEKS